MTYYAKKTQSIAMLTYNLNKTESNVRIIQKSNRN